LVNTSYENSLPVLLGKLLDEKLSEFLFSGGFGDRAAGTTKRTKGEIKAHYYALFDSADKFDEQGKPRKEGYYRSIHFSDYACAVKKKCGIDLSEQMTGEYKIISGTEGAEIERLKTELLLAKEKLAIYEKSEEQRALDEESAKSLADKNIPFRTMPPEVYPGMRYLKPDDIERIEPIKYHPSYVRRLTQDGSENGIPAIQIDGETFLTPSSVAAVLERQEARVRNSDRERALRPGGRKPGNRKKAPLTPLTPRAVS
jgi:hypothetical protein